MDLTRLHDRYRMRAPRYTSYPTAPHFGPIAAEAVDAALGAGTGDLSVYVHVPFCQQLCWYCGCHREIRSRRAVATPYVDALLAEAALLAARMQPGRRLKQLALGGGTPTFLEPGDMTRLVEGLVAHWPRAEAAEWSVEVDPRSVDGAYLDRLVDLGFRRFSFGVQDIDPAVMEAIHRVQDPEVIAAHVARLRRTPGVGVSFDLLYGLPHQEPARFDRTLQWVRTVRPDRVSLFAYAHVPWMMPHPKLLEGRLPDVPTRMALFELASRRLLEEGYERLGMDHFALPGDTLVRARAAGTLHRNFQGYSTHRGLDQVGLGTSAIGSFGGVYVQNAKERGAHLEAVRAGRLPLARGFVLSDEDRLRREVIQDRFCLFETRWADHGTTAGHFVDALAALAPMERDGLVEIRPDGLALTRPGREFVRVVCAAFDAYFEPDASARRYSQTA